MASHEGSLHSPSLAFVGSSFQQRNHHPTVKVNGSRLEHIRPEDSDLRACSDRMASIAALSAAARASSTFFLRSMPCSLFGFASNRPATASSRHERNNAELARAQAMSQASTAAPAGCLARASAARRAAWATTSAAQIAAEAQVDSRSTSIFILCPFTSSPSGQVSLAVRNISRPRLQHSSNVAVNASLNALLPRTSSSDLARPVPSLLSPLPFGGRGSCAPAAAAELDTATSGAPATFAMDPLEEPNWQR
mmetsp:Transcript_16389/g.57287  ORF Transcript_16389/g.57287 Transcript_16389/m.57287 type:complete len:251 (+) Transcript_16389:76-828(+)